MACRYPEQQPPDVVLQLIWRALGPLKGRAKSVLDWAGLGQAPPALLREIGARYGVSGPAVGQRIQRVAAVGSRLPLTAALENEVSRRSAPGGEPRPPVPVGRAARPTAARTARREPRAF
jgi:hypothetical protein